MSEFLLERDHRRKLWYEKDPVTGLITVRTEWNNDLHLGLTKDARAASTGSLKTRKSKDGFDMHQACHIPPSVVPQLVEMGICLPGGALVPGADKAFLQWLEKSENHVFKVTNRRFA